jgi:hypothetical protein
MRSISREKALKRLNSYDHLGVGQYSITIRNKEGCPGILSPILFPSCDTLYMPTAFTPNGDGTTDYLRPIYGTAISEVSFHVFNALGEKIYEFTGVGKGWMVALIPISSQRAVMLLL